MGDLVATFLLALRLLMAVALYSFLGWAMLTMWRDFHKQAEQASQRQVHPILFSLLDPLGEEQIRFSSPEIHVGRHPSCEWVLQHETVSSRHARLSFHHDHWWLEDLGSRNGTFLNDERVTESVVLANQDVVRCGEMRFAILLEQALEA